MLDADPVKTVGVEVAAGMVTFAEYEATLVPSGVAVDVGVELELEEIGMTL